MNTNKKCYQRPILSARRKLRKALYFEAYDILGLILEDMEKEDD